MEEYRFFRTYGDTTIFNYLLLKQITDKKLNPNNCLIECVRECTVKDFFIPFCIVLRNGANPNYYHNGRHILSYIVEFTAYDNLNIMHHLYNTLIISGAKDSMAYDLNSTLSIKNWIDTEYPTFKQLGFTDDDKVVYDIALDRDSSQTPIGNKFMLTCIKSFSHKWLKKIKVDFDDVEKSQSFFIKNSIIYCNLKSLTIFLKNGIKPNYLDVNCILYNMKTFNDENVVVNELFAILIEIEKYGYNLDYEQYDFLKSVTVTCSDDKFKRFCDFVKPKDTICTYLYYTNKYGITTKINAGDAYYIMITGKDPDTGSDISDLDIIDALSVRNSSLDDFCIIQAFTRLCKDYDLDISKLYDITTDSWSNIYITLGYTSTPVLYFSIEHIIITTAFIVLIEYKKNKQIVDQFFSIIKQ